MILGDCLEVMPTLPKASVQMAFADFPYGGATRCKWDKRVDLDLFWLHAKAVCPPTATVIASAIWPFDLCLIESARKSFSYKLVWDKGSSGSFHLAKFKPLKVHEEVLVFSMGKRGVYNPQMIKREKPRIRKLSDISKVSDSGGTGALPLALVGRIYTHRHPTSILRISPAKKDRGMHPTQKPVALLDWLIRTYSNPGDTVLDPVSGSGTTAVAALQNGRHVVCVEKNENYFDASVERVRKAIVDGGIDATIEVRR